MTAETGSKTMPVKTTTKPGRKRPVALAIRELQTLDARLIAAAAKGLDAGLFLVQGIADRDYLSGPAPAKLRKITTTLAKGLTHKVETKKTKVVGKVGNPVKYAARHEFGFKGTEQVRAHVRVLRNISGTGAEIPRRALNDAQGNLLAYRETKKQVARRQRTGAVTFARVQAHTRKVNYPGKPYLAPAIKDAQPMILDAIKDALKTVKSTEN